MEKLPIKQRDAEQSNRIENVVQNLKKLWNEGTGLAKKELDTFKTKL